jgi:hypothetical protein
VTDFSSPADAVDASVCDLSFLREQDALCGWVKARVHLVFPYWDLVILTLTLFLHLLQNEKQQAFVAE